MICKFRMEGGDLFLDINLEARIPDESLTDGGMVILHYGADEDHPVDPALGVLLQKLFDENMKKAR